MSECSVSTSETSTSDQEEPTVVSVPIVGSSATDGITTAWENDGNINISSSTNLPPLSVSNEVVSTNTESSSLASSHHVSQSVSQSELTNPIEQSFVQSGMCQHPDSTSSGVSSGSLSESDRVLVDSSLVSNLHSLAEQGISLSHQIADNTDHNLDVMDTLNSQRSFLSTDGNLDDDILVSFHHPESSDMLVVSSNVSRTIAQNLSTFDHSSVSSTQEQIDMQNLLQEHQELNSASSVDAMSDYHLDQSEAPQIPSVGSSHLDIDTSTSEVKSNVMCLSPSSNNIYHLPSGITLTSGAGLPPVSTIIRSSSSLAAAKGRFDGFPNANSLGLGLTLPPLLSNSNAFGELPSLSSIQPSLVSTACDSLTIVTIASPSLCASSEGHDASCGTLMDTESIGVPHSSTVVSSSSSSSDDPNNIETMKSTSVMTSSLGPDTVCKNTDLSEIDPCLEPGSNIDLPLSTTTTMSLSSFSAIVSTSESNIGASSSQVSLDEAAINIDDVQKFRALVSQNRAENTSSYSLTSDSISLVNANNVESANSCFHYSDELQEDSITESLNKNMDPHLIPVSAIETNVIMSTSSIESACNTNRILDSTGIKNNHLSSLNIDDQLDAAEMMADSTMQNLIASQQIENDTFQSAMENSPLLSVSAGRCSTEDESLHPMSEISDINEHIENQEKNNRPSSSNINIKFSSGISSDKAPSSFVEAREVSVVTSGVAASVIQQLLTTESPLKKLKPAIQHIKANVITSVMGTKIMPPLLPVQQLTSSSIRSCIEDSMDSSSSSSFGVGISIKQELPSSSDELDCTSTASVGKCNENQVTSATPTLSTSALNIISATSLPNLNSVALPSFFSSLASSSLASLHSGLCSPVSITVPSSSHSSTHGVTGTSVSLLPSVQQGLVSAPISAVSPILLPNILSSPLTKAVSTIKTLSGEASLRAEVASTTASNFSGLFKANDLPVVIKHEPVVIKQEPVVLKQDSVVLKQEPVIIKQEPVIIKQEHLAKQDTGTTCTGPLPPFTVVSGFSPLVKQSMGASLASTLLSVRSGSSPNITAVTIKQEPGESTTSPVSASGFSPTTVLNTGATLPSLATIRLPTIASMGLSMVATTVVSPPPSLTSPVPSQASIIAFAGNTTCSAATTTATVLTTNPIATKDKGVGDKKLCCLLCKNGNPCSIHLLPAQGSSSQAPQPLPSGDPSKPFQCTVCGKHLASKNVFQLHMRSHSGEKPFTCSLCGHHFSQKTSLTRHMRSHTGERPFPCEVCGKRFADKERIKIHMRTHTGEKPFACEVCGKRFSQKSTVKRHMSVHTGEKPFKCETCGKGFANRGNLNAHSKTHANT